MRYFIHLLCKVFYLILTANLAHAVEETNKCEEGQSCFYMNCNGIVGCSTVVTHVDNGDSLSFQLVTENMQPKTYISIGFSNRQEMNNASVMECVMTATSEVKVYSSYNLPDIKNNVRLTTMDGVTKVGGSISDGHLTCYFTIAKERTINSVKFNLHHPHNLLFAYGNVDENNGLTHHRFRFVSPTPLTLSQKKIFTFNPVGRDIDKIKAHASLMIVAWVALTSIGIIVARYYKHMWPNTKIFDLLVWFQIHRAIMLTNVCCTIIGFILIFIANEGYKSTGKNPHPITGIVTFILCLIQPIMAFFRCTPDAENRYIFNWAHWFVGTSAHILAVATIFLGFQLAFDNPKNSVINYLDGVMGTFVVVHIFTELILDIHLCITSKERTFSSQDLHLRELSKSQLTPGLALQPPGARFKNIVLIVYCVLVVILTVTLLILVNLNFPEA